ncbi:hypothetical protein KJ564_14630, partial [bacterium]|nr:hypothetical protein [bacterium]
RSFHLDESSVNQTLEFTEESLTDFANRLLNLHSHPQIKFWIAVCASKDHDEQATWLGTKRSERRQAIRDAIEHKQVTGHRVGVIGPIE